MPMRKLRLLRRLLVYKLLLMQRLRLLLMLHVYKRLLTQRVRLLQKLRVFKRFKMRQMLPRRRRHDCKQLQMLPQKLNA